MNYITTYKSPVGNLIITADSVGITSISFDRGEILKGYVETDCVLFERVKKWLDLYFLGKNPNFTLPLNFTGTPFQNLVNKTLLDIPYGTTLSYKQVAIRVAEKMGVKKTSNQAVGGAVGKNKIAIVVPCHRVIGSNGSLVGYAGGLDKKRFLLQLEKVNI